MKHHVSAFPFLLFSLFVSFQTLHAKSVQTHGSCGGSVSILAVSPASGVAGGMNLCAGSEGGGIWIQPLSKITAVRTRPEVHLTTYSLEQNYPDLFNPLTVIDSQLPALVL